MRGHILIAMPHLTDPYFSRSIVLICEHDENGAMGLIVNKTFDDQGIKAIFPDLVVNDDAVKETFTPIYFGGPVSLERGFILHSTDYLTEETMRVSNEFSLTSNSTVMDDIKLGDGPGEYRLMLGYAGWGENQLEREIENGDWLFQSTDREFVFRPPNGDKWLEATRSFGIDVAPSTGGQA